MAAVWDYMEDPRGSRKPDDLVLLDYIETYGVQAVVGRPLGAGELKRMTIARNVRNAYMSRAGYRDSHGNENWAEWAMRYPEYSEILNEAARLSDISAMAEVIYWRVTKLRSS